MTTFKRQDAENVRDIVRRAYKEIAQSGATCCGPGSSCCGASPAAKVAQLLGYDAQALKLVPPGANRGLSCGNPTALASLRPGQVVLDLGSGAGLDVFLAALKVGPAGRAIGVDMTPEMVSAARQNAEEFRRRTGLDNVEFRLGEIEHLPVADASVDRVISNCVINLSPDKPQVWREIARVLKPGGRAVVSDVGLLKPLPDSLLRSGEALVGCIAGAVSPREVRQMVRAAGLTNVTIRLRPIWWDDGGAQAGSCCAKAPVGLPEGTALSDFVVSMDIMATKPRSHQSPR